jgi:type II secretory pathway pseudopilin PulG
MMFSVVLRDYLLKGNLTHHFSEMKNQLGFTYFGVLFLVFLISMAMVGASTILSIQLKRQKEKELIFIGNQYVNALSSYYRFGPDGLNEYPKSINDLLEDRRTIVIKRHLRKPFKDPFSQNSDMEIIKSEEGRIIGVRSNSSSKPLKQANFGEGNESFGGKKSYRDWGFLYLPIDSLGLKEGEDEGQKND